MAKQEQKTGGITKRSNLERLQQKVKELALDNFYYEMSAFFRDKLAAYEWPNPGGFSYSLSELTESGGLSNLVYISLYLVDSQPGKVKIYIQPRAIEVATEDFEALKGQLGDKFRSYPNGGGEILVNSKEWDEIRPIFENICPKIVEGWKRKRERQVDNEFKEASQEVAEQEKKDE